MARRFGTEQSGSFVNGVLDAAYRRYGTANSELGVGSSE